MEKEMLLAELRKNCEGKEQKLLELLKAFDLACIGYEMQDQHSKDIHNRVLQENEFFAAKDFSRWEPKFKVGDRVTDEEYLFLLSDEDFDKVMKLARPICVAEKLTDERGYFLENWVEIRSKARHELVSYIIYNVIPENVRQFFYVCLHNIVQSDKLINIFKGCLGVAA